VGYPELRQALREETRRQLGEIEAEAARRAAEIVAAARAEADREREATCAEAELLAAEADRRAAARQALEQERLLLLEARRLLDALRAEAAARLPGLVDKACRARLAAELAGELDGASWELGDGGLVATRGGRTVDNTPPARLARAWPALEPQLAAILFGEPT